MYSGLCLDFFWISSQSRGKPWTEDTGQVYSESLEEGQSESIPMEDFLGDFTVTVVIWNTKNLENGFFADMTLLCYLKSIFRQGYIQN